MVVPRERRTWIIGPDDAACAELRAELLIVALEAALHARRFALGGDIGAATACLGVAQYIEAALSEAGDEQATGSAGMAE